MVGVFVPHYTLTMSAATVVHISNAQASLVKLLPLAEHCRPPITGFEQRHAASDWTEKERQRREKVRTLLLLLMG